MADLTSFVERLSSLTVMEAIELARLLETKWGVSATAPVAVQQSVEIPQEVVEEQTEFEVILASIDPAKKIGVIKEVRTLTSLGLKEAKELVENAPKQIRAVVSKEEAVRIKEQIEAAGGTIELR